MKISLKDDFDRRDTFQGSEYDIPLLLTMDVEGEMKGGIFTCSAAVRFTEVIFTMLKNSGDRVHDELSVSSNDFVIPLTRILNFRLLQIAILLKRMSQKVLSAEFRVKNSSLHSSFLLITQHFF